MEFNTGLLLFVVVLAFPILAVGTPFFNLWYARNHDKVTAQLVEVRSQIEELREKRDAAYREDEAEAEETV